MNVPIPGMFICSIIMKLKWSEPMVNKIAFVDLQAQQERVRPQVDKAIAQVLNHGRYILGPEVQELEKRLADFTGVKHAIGVASGTDALLMALMANGVGPGDAVFTTPFTFIATAEVVSLLGATPVFVDIDSRTYNIDPGQLAFAIKALRQHDPSIYPLPANHKELTAKAIIPVDLFGLPADYDAINTLADHHNLFVLEDAAQGLGGKYKGRQACSLAHAAITSFFPAKPLGGYGDGGAIFTDDDKLADTLRSIRVHGKGIDKYDNIRIGVNGRLDTLQAAILLPKLDIFPQEIEQRQRVAQRYSDALSCTSLVTPYVPGGLQSVWAQYSLISEDREALQVRLKEKGVPSAVYYEKPLHLQPAYDSLQYMDGSMPASEHISQHIFSLPMHPYLSDEDVDKIVSVVKE